MKRKPRYVLWWLKRDWFQHGSSAQKAMPQADIEVLGVRMSAVSGPHFQGFKHQQSALHWKHFCDEVEKSVKEMQGKLASGTAS